MTLATRFHLAQEVKIDGVSAKVTWIAHDGSKVQVTSYAHGYSRAITLTENEARRRIRVAGESIATVLTSKQRMLLERLRATTGIFLRGNEVALARKLMALELVVLQDRGRQKDSGRRNGEIEERWWCVPAELGYAKDNSQ